MEELLKKLSIANEDGTISVTNVVVFIFVFITAFRSLFSGTVIDLGAITWKIEALDVSSTLPLLFGLLNYGHKRLELNKKVEKNEV